MNETFSHSDHSIFKGTSDSVNMELGVAIAESEKEEIKEEVNEECDVCGQNHQTEECPELGLSSNRFTPQISRARLTAPHYLNPVEFPDGHVGVVALEPISNKTQLGPFEAKKTMHRIDREDLFVLKILSKDGSHISLDASSEGHCNWMALVQVAGSEEEQNCMAYQLGINIYFNTTRDLQVGDELKVWYAPQYAKKLGKSLTPDGNTKSMLGETLVTEPYSEEEADEGTAIEEEGNDELSQNERDPNMEDCSSHTVTEGGDQMRPVEDVEGEFTCKKCGSNFTSQFLFAKHIREHLFPVYNYSEGPPRRGRRPVPLKLADRSGTSSTRGGNLRGTGRKRGRPRGSRSSRGGMISTSKRSGRAPGSTRVKRDLEEDRDEEEELDEEPPSKQQKTSEEESRDEGDDEEIEMTNAEASEGVGKTKEIESTEDSESEAASQAKQAKSPGRAKNIKGIKDRGMDFTPLSESNESGLRRSSRALKGLGRLGRWMRYPGEESSEDEGTEKTMEEEELKPRKRFGIAMAASLRKAAMDEMTSPAGRRKGTAAAVGSRSPRTVASGSQANAKVQNVKVSYVKSLVKTGKVAQTESASSPKAKGKPDQSKSGKNKEAKLETGQKSPEKTVDVDSPKKYIVITDGDTSTKYEIVTSPANTSELEEGEVLPSTSSEVQSSASAMSCSSSSAVTTTAEIHPEELTTGEEPTSPDDATLQPIKNSKTEEAREENEQEEVEKLVQEMAEELSTDQQDTPGAVVEIQEVQQDLEEEEAVPKTEDAEVVVGTQEEVVEVRTHERKNTIADLDGSDALTALVNAAISADKVPDPIAMVAADLYDDRSLEVAEEDDVEYRTPSKGVLGYSSEVYASSDGMVGKQSGSDRPKAKRKKRKKGDDPELETLESLTKFVDGLNGTGEYVCGICNKHFTMLKYLKLHLPAHTDRFRCKVCGKRFARNESLLKHTCDDTANLVEQVIDDEGNEAFNCKECGRSFNQLNFATRHASMHRTRFTCQKCGRTFLREDLLEEHECHGAEKEDGEVGEKHECQICKQSFTNGKYLFRHMAMHTDIYKCEVCGKCYSRKDSLQRHISRCCPQLSQEYSVHVCPNCKKTFGTQLGLSNHMINCGKYQCGSCKVAYFSIKDLAEHDCSGKVINEKASVQFPCKECNKTFASIAYLVRHEASHHDAFKCDHCGKVFIRKEELNWHTPVCSTRQKIIDEGKAPCEVCGEEFSEWLAFKEHHMTHTHPHRCDKCAKRFIKIGTLHNHKCENTGSENVGGAETKGKPSLLSCDVCGKTFKNERYLSRHISLHGQPEHSCEFCGKSFTRKDYLNDHQCRMPDGTTVRMVRKKNRIFIKDKMACTQCGKTFSSRSNMMKHMKVHGDKQAECHICHKRFHYENYLKLHIATVHEKQFQLQCKHCSKILYSKTGLIAHIKQFHAETIKLYPCPKCGKTFRQKGNMKTHLISHTKERAFKCDICAKAFKYPDQLNRHRLEHTLTQKFSCEMCDKQFVRSYELRNHIRNYHSGFVYVCGVCHECCAHRHTIIRHYKRKHPEVGNMFEEKPEFLDSLQKPVSAATHSRMMVEGASEDMKPSLLRVGPAPGGHREVIITSAPGDQEGQAQAASFGAAGGEVILQGTDLLGTGDQAVLDGTDSTVFILKVVNQEDGEGGVQEMELSEDTKAHLAQLLQAHSTGQDTITHIQVGDQTLQIHREVEEVVMPESSGDNMTFVQEIKFDPQQLEAMSQGAEVATSAGVKVQSETTSPAQTLVPAGTTLTLAPQEMNGAGSTTIVQAPGAATTSAVVAEAPMNGAATLSEVVTLEGSEDVLGGHQVVEMGDGRLGRLLQMEDGQTMLQVIQMEGNQVIQLEDNQLLTLDTTEHTTVATPDNNSSTVTTTTNNDAIPSQGDLDNASVLQSVLQAGLKVRRRRTSQGELVLEVEGHDDGGSPGGQQVIQVLDPAGGSVGTLDAVIASSSAGGLESVIVSTAAGGQQGDGRLVSAIEVGVSSAGGLEESGEAVVVSESGGDLSTSLLLGGEEEEPQQSATGREGPISQLELQLTQSTPAPRSLAPTTQILAGEEEEEEAGPKDTQDK